MGSLSWFATVYIEMHYGFAGAYGLTLGFLVLAMLMLITGRHWYSMHKSYDRFVRTKLIILQFEFLVKGTFSRMWQEFLPAHAETGLKWHMRIQNTRLCTVIRLLCGVTLVSLSMR